MRMVQQELFHNQAKFYPGKYQPIISNAECAIQCKKLFDSDVDRSLSLEVTNIEGATLGYFSAYTIQQKSIVIP